MEVVKVMDRQKVADTLHRMLDTGCDLLDRNEYHKEDFVKIKVLRTMSASLSSAVMMVQQETAQQRTSLVAEKMKQLGYGEPKAIEER
jgi:hypothetical protein